MPQALKGHLVASLQAVPLSALIRAGKLERILSLSGMMGSLHFKIYSSAATFFLLCYFYSYSLRHTFMLL